MRIELATTLVATAVFVSGCDVVSSPPTSTSPVAPPPASSESAFRGSYEVPVPANLAAAAQYPVASIHWSVTQGVGRLTYDLPLDLVGRSIGLSFEGPIDASGGTATLTGNAGRADCVIDSASVVCHETMNGLSPLSPDYGVVEKLAAADYAGPAADRVDVAQRFAGDPIGIVHVDLAAPVSNGSGSQNP